MLRVALQTQWEPAARRDRKRKGWSPFFGVGAVATLWIVRPLFLPLMPFIRKHLCNSFVIRFLFFFWCPFSFLTQAGAED